MINFGRCVLSQDGAGRREKLRNEGSVLGVGRFGSHRIVAIWPLPPGLTGPPVGKGRSRFIVWRQEDRRHNQANERKRWGGTGLDAKDGPEVEGRGRDRGGSRHGENVCSRQLDGCDSRRVRSSARHCLQLRYVRRAQAFHSALSFISLAFPFETCGL